MRILAECLKKAGINIAALQETRFPGKDVVEVPNNYAFYYSGRSVERSRAFGTGFVVMGTAMKSVIDFNPVSERLCTLRLRGYFYNITLINAHAPTEDKDDEVKERYYEELQTAYNRAPHSDIKIVLGDFNAKVGQESAYRPTIGPHSLHESSNGNGEKLIDFALSNNLVVSSTYFPHKRIHKATWTSPDGQTANQIDHVLIDGRHRWNALDVRSYRGPNIDSDHFLVRLKFRARIDARNSRQPPPRRYDVEKLSGANNRTRALYETRMEQRIIEEMLEAPPAANVEDMWSRVRKTVECTAEEVVGRKGPARRNDWFDDECRRALDAKNAARTKHLQRGTRASWEDYRTKRTIERRLFRRKKVQVEQDLIASIEHLSSVKDIRGMYRTVKATKGGSIHQPLLCRDEVERCWQTAKSASKDGRSISTSYSTATRHLHHTDKLAHQQQHSSSRNPWWRSQVLRRLNLLWPTSRTTKRLARTTSPASSSSMAVRPC